MIILAAVAVEAVPRLINEKLRGRVLLRDQRLDAFHRDAAVEAAEVNFNNHPGAVTSPMVGTAYRAPEPGARPFCDVGDTVKVGQTLLIVEAMKTMNAIPATKAGKVTHVLIEDGMPVEFGQPLVIVE